MEKQPSPEDKRMEDTLKLGAFMLTILGAVGFASGSII